MSPEEIWELEFELNRLNALAVPPSGRRGTRDTMTCASASLSLLVSPMVLESAELSRFSNLIDGLLLAPPAECNRWSGLLVAGVVVLLLAVVRDTMTCSSSSSRRIIAALGGGVLWLIISNSYLVGSSFVVVR